MEEEKSHNSDLLMSINVADRVAYEAQEKNVLLEREIENLKLKLAALTGKFNQLFYNNTHPLSFKSSIAQVLSASSKYNILLTILCNKE